MMRIGIFSKPNEPRAVALAARIAAWAKDQEIPLLTNERLRDLPDGSVAATDKEIVEQSEFIVALGGDGTMLAVARLLACRDTPVLGINLGTLGYLTEFTVEEAIPALEQAIRGN